MPLKVEIEPEELVKKKADSRGRITLGSEYADEEIKLLIVSDPEGEDR